MIASGNRAELWELIWRYRQVFLKDYAKRSLSPKFCPDGFLGTPESLDPTEATFGEAALSIKNPTLVFMSMIRKDSTIVSVVTQKVINYLSSG